MSSRSISAVLRVSWVLLSMVFDVLDCELRVIVIRSFDWPHGRAFVDCDVTLEEIPVRESPFDPNEVCRRCLVIWLIHSQSSIPNRYHAPSFHLLEYECRVGRIVYNSITYLFFGVERKPTWRLFAFGSFERREAMKRNFDAMQFITMFVS